MPTFSRYSNEPNHWKDIHMGGGIQPGTTAKSIESDKVDSDTKKISRLLLDKYSTKYDLTWIPKLNRHQVPFNNTACAPDGGIFIHKGNLVFSTEAKHQKAQKNAIERWHKNHNVLRMINPSITYLTFATGAAVTQAIPLALDFMHLGEPNIPHPFYNTIYYNVNGFSLVEMFELSESLLITTLEGINNNETAIYVGRWKNKIDQALSTILS